MMQKIINRLDQLITVFEPLSAVANCHMVDFFTKNIYQTQICPKIQQEINNLGCEDTLKFMLNITSPENCPNLKNFLINCKNHTLPNFKDVCLNLTDLQIKLIDLGCQKLSGLHLEVFMNSKKSHEVEIMSEISSAMSEIARTDYIVDIGDGKGYLSSALALHNGLKVLGIDSSDINTKSAAKRAGKLQKMWNKNTTGSDLYKQATKYVTEDMDLIPLIENHFPGENINSLSLVGLHTCGDLASCCLRLFSQNSNVKTICNVGCCYHLLTEDSGFPMSRYLKEKHFILSRNARMLSCQSLDRILDKKELPGKILFYRSVLQILILRHCPELVDKQVGRFTNKHTTTFVEYAQKSFRKIEAELKLSEQELIEFYENHKYLEQYLQIFYLLRAHVAPIIEGIILLDRLLFLHEQGIDDAFLIQLFDPVISPRCYGLVAFKNELHKY